MRSFTSSRPVWSASSTARAWSRSRWSWDRLSQGSSSTVSSQVRIHPCSGDWSLRAVEPGELPVDGVADGLGEARAPRAWPGRRRRRPRRRGRRPAPCGWPPAAGAGGTPAGSSPCPRTRRCGSSRSARLRRGPPWPSPAPAAPVRSRRPSPAARPCGPSERSGHQPAASASSAGVLQVAQLLDQAPPTDVGEQGAERGPQLGGQLAGFVGDLGFDGLGLEPEHVAGAGHAGAEPGPARRPGPPGRACRRAGRRSTRCGR